MKALYKSQTGRFYVTYDSGRGSYDIRQWPSEEIMATRDWKQDAVKYCQSLEQAATNGTKAQG